MTERADIAETIGRWKKRCADNTRDGFTLAVVPVAELAALVAAAEAVERTETCLRAERQGARGRLLEVIDRALASLKGAA